VRSRIIGSAVIVGAASLDTNIIDGAKYRRLGGAVTYAGLTFARHGIDTSVTTTIGRRDRRILRRLSAEGLKVHAVLGEYSTVLTNYIAADERRQVVRSCAAAISSPMFALGSAPLCVIGAILPTDIAEDGILAIERWGGRVALDLQGYTRMVLRGRVVPGASGLLARLLGVATIVKADVNELRIVCNDLALDPEQLMARFGVDEMIETGGSRGGRVYVRGIKEYAYAAVAVRRVRDTTGAGDVFFAAYLVARLAWQRTTAGAADYAAGIAARHVSGRYLPAELLERG
jgi:sugar/nucleoside kinase (ribokinase family)